MLQRKILSQALPEGTDLPSEAELMDEHGLSRATVREAIRILDVLGFVRVNRGRRGGMVVAHPDSDMLGSLMATQLTLNETPARALAEMRGILEPAAAQIVAQRGGGGLVDRIGQLAPSTDGSAEVSFHLLLAEATGNDVLAMTMRSIFVSLRAVSAYEPIADRDLELGARAHLRIYKALVEGDAEWAAAAMRKHLRAVHQVSERGGHLDAVAVPPSIWGSADGPRAVRLVTGDRAPDPTPTEPSENA